MNPRLRTSRVRSLSATLALRELQQNMDLSVLVRRGQGIPPRALLTKELPAKKETSRTRDAALSGLSMYLRLPVRQLQRLGQE